MLSSRRTSGKRRPWGLLVLLSSGRPDSLRSPRPGGGRSRPESRTGQEETGGNGRAQCHRPGAAHLSRRPHQAADVPVVSEPVVADGKIYILTTKDLGVTGIVVYDSTQGRGQSFPLPEDLKPNHYFRPPSFSPDGTKVAYYFVPTMKTHLNLRNGNRIEEFH